VKPAEWVHGAYVADQRVRVLRDRMAEIAPPDSTLLDVGCGDGKLTYELSVCRPDLRCQGIDVLVREETRVPVTEFDGRHIPHPDDSFDIVMLIDVVHHAEDPRLLLRESARVARRCLLIKDHRLEPILAAPTLRFMDRVSNARYGVSLPHNYWSEQQWRSEWAEAKLDVEHFDGGISLYPWPFSLLFDRGLHFIARLGVR
jgi:SAM-dependent methyltransferase